MGSRSALLTVFLIFLTSNFCKGQILKTSLHTISFQSKLQNQDSIAQNILSKIIQPDKAQHFWGSLFSTIFIEKFTRKHFGFSKSTGRQFSVGITLSLGIIKELNDRNKPHNFFSWGDLVADTAGIIAGIMLANQP